MASKTEHDPPVDPAFDQKVRETAYFLWEQDGRPEGREQDYWDRALERTLREHDADRKLQDGPRDGRHREPMGDHNRRLSLGMDLEQFAAEAGISAQALRDYELTPAGAVFDLAVAEKVGAALERLEADPPDTQKVVN